ncbi:MAG: Nicotinate phosphoribosyltransferase [Micavibrio sp.]|nr:Nicotinate phosphoribosyltransferase [Micavibrio sp.]
MPYVGRDQDYEEPLAAPSAMWADLYALTMAQALFLEGRHDQQATFHAFVRKTPHNAAYMVTAGQNIVAEWLDKNWRFTDRDIRTLAKKTTKDPVSGNQVPIFKPEFLEMLKNAKHVLSLVMMPEGEIAFASEPVYKVSGPVWQALLVESAILNTMNSQSNFATYASILKTAANGKPVAEFGLRRAQAVGGLSSTRGSYVGGIDASSNCWAETNYGIPTIGTMAHAYVMMHDTELDAYINWAKHSPHLGVFLPDTYEPIEGMKKVIQACTMVGTTLQGFRQDSGDLGYLAQMGKDFASQSGTQLLKNAVSNDLDAQTIVDLERQTQAIDMYAVGTKLATVADQPALGGVYKIANIYDAALSHQEIIAMKAAVRAGLTEPKDIRDKVRDIMKLSSQSVKMTFPGELDLIRYLTEKNGKLMFNGGTICQEWTKDPLLLSDPKDMFSGRLTQDIMSVKRDNHILSKTFNAGTRAYRPIQPFFEAGKLVGDIETVHIARARALQRLTMLDAAHKRLLNPHEHVVGVEESLLYRQEAMGRRLRNTGNTVAANLV